MSGLLGLLLLLLFRMLILSVIQPILSSTFVVRKLQNNLLYTVHLFWKKVTLQFSYCHRFSWLLQSLVGRTCRYMLLICYKETMSCDCF
jgi:hypothetical protein